MVQTNSAGLPIVEKNDDAGLRVTAIIKNKSRGRTTGLGLPPMENGNLVVRR